MPSPITPKQVSSYLQYLPAVFQQVAAAAGTPWIGSFLLAFEHILGGLGDPDVRGVEEIIDNIGSYFMPTGNMKSAQTPIDFLPWLAGWVTVSLREDWTENERRRFIGRIVLLYQQRGTPAGMTEMLRIHTGIDQIQLSELNLPFQVGKICTVGVDTAVKIGLPHYFRVKIILLAASFLITQSSLTALAAQNLPQALIDVLSSLENQEFKGTETFKREVRKQIPDLLKEQLEIYWPQILTRTLQKVDLARRRQIAEATIVQEKPAHTTYDLSFEAPRCQVGTASTVGIDSWVGTALKS